MGVGLATGAGAGVVAGTTAVCAGVEGAGAGDAPFAEGVATVAGACDADDATFGFRTETRLSTNNAPTSVATLTVPLLSLFPLTTLPHGGVSQTAASAHQPKDRLLQVRLARPSGRRFKTSARKCQVTRVTLVKFCAIDFECSPSRHALTPGQHPRLCSLTKSSPHLPNMRGKNGSR